MRRANSSRTKKESFHPKDIWEGLTAAVSVKVTDPQFEGQTKSRLNNSEAKGAVQTFVYAAFGEWLRDKSLKKDADAILTRCVEARESRMARGRADSKRKRGVFDESPLPGKLEDCLDSSPVEDREIFIVEGDSALGTAGDARDKRYQAVLPVRGKILNVLGAKNDRIWANNEIESILVAMGGRKEAVGKRVIASLAAAERRYGKIVILTDADTDGAHICNLLLGMFHELFPTLVSEGRIFVAGLRSSRSISMPKAKSLCTPTTKPNAPRWSRSTTAKVTTFLGSRDWARCHGSISSRPASTLRPGSCSRWRWRMSAKQRPPST